MSSSTTYSNVFDAPTLGNEDSVQFYYLESAFPYNAPSSIKQQAGQAFNDYATTHAGLGVWDVTSDVRFSIEFLAANYTGALFPQTNSVTGELIWANQGEVVVTNPLVQDYWVNSRLIASTSGYSYASLIDYLQQNIGLYSAYQPVSVTYATEAQLLNFTSGVAQSSNSIGLTQLAPMNSYAALDVWINQLAIYGCDVESFLQVYSTGFFYLSSMNYNSNDRRKLESASTLSSSYGSKQSNYLLSRGSSFRNSVDMSSLDISSQPIAFSSVIETTNIPVVSWEMGHPNMEVVTWYSELSLCYQKSFTDLGDMGGQASALFKLVPRCYGSYAYVYRSPTTVYNVSLANYSNIGVSTPILGRYIYDLPSVNLNTGIPMAIIDYFVTVIVFLSVIAGLVYFIWRMLRKRRRRAVSFMGEQVAVNTVKNLQEDENSHINYFYRDTSNTNARSSKNSEGLLQNPMSSSNENALKQRLL